MTFASILITGASSGIGAALARHYAAPGITLNLWGRDGLRLAAVAEECRMRGATVVTAAFDVTEYSKLVIALDAADKAHPLDLAIFNAGLGGSLPKDLAGQDARHAELMAGVNFTAPAIGANVVAQRMAARKKGRIVLIGSVAAQFPLPMAPLYSGSKAGLAMFAEALSLRLRRHGVAVTLVAPGFIDTPMSQSLNEPRPFLISAEKAAAIIARSVAKGRRRIVLPWQFSMILGLSKLVPRVVVRAILSVF